MAGLCTLCGVLMRDGLLPLSWDAYNHNLCSLCYVRNRATKVSDDMFGCCLIAEDPKKTCRVEYFGTDVTIVALVSWADDYAVHLAELVPETTGYES